MEIFQYADNRSYGVVKEVDLLIQCFLWIRNSQIPQQDFIYQEFFDCIGNFQISSRNEREFKAWHIFIIRFLKYGIEIRLFYGMVEFDIRPVVVIVFDGRI